MIATVTPNPAIEETLWIDALSPGGVNPVRAVQLDPGGKGINVSRTVHRLGHPTVAFGFLAGELGALVERTLDEDGVQYHFIRVPGLTPVNLRIVESASGVSTSLHGAAPTVAADRAAILEEIVAFWLQPGSVLVLAGGLAPGMSPRTYETLVRCARAREARVVVDAEGEPLRHAISAGPDLVNASVAEAERLLDRRLPGADAVLDAAHDIVRLGAGAAVISMEDGGAVYAAHDCWRVHAAHAARGSTAGSGDAMLAGLAIGLAVRMPPASMLRLAAAAGAAAATVRGTSLLTAADVQALLERIDVEPVKGRGEAIVARA